MGRRSQAGRRSRGADRGARRTTVRDGSDLCLRCGLCCDGTVFSDITIDDDEEEFVRSLELQPRRNADGRLVSPQPCSAFVDGCCSLYERGRPATCETYTCGLLRGYTEGSASLEDALGVVRLVRALAHELADEMELPTRSYDRARLTEYLEREQPHEHPHEHATFLVAFHRLMHLGLKYFGYRPRPEEEAAADAGGAVLTDATPR
jgi:hypothetical protein